MGVAGGARASIDNGEEAGRSHDAVCKIGEDDRCACKNAGEAGEDAKSMGLSPSSAKTMSDHELEQQSVSELIATALVGDEDDERAWSAVWELRRRGTDEVFEAASALLGSVIPKERWRGADILAQLGVTTPGGPRPSVALRTRCADQLLRLLEVEADPGVLNSIGVALGHLDDPRAPEALIPLVNHKDPEVREAVVIGLLGHAQPTAVEGLIRLSSDPADEVRIWATFGLGEQIEEVDTPELREALVERLTDPVAEVRGEALRGLVLRKDARARDALFEELAASTVNILAVEAAGALGVSLGTPPPPETQGRPRRGGRRFRTRPR